eukprot:12890-Heterococcus_DN1.PRE.4
MRTPRAKLSTPATATMQLQCTVQFGIPVGKACGDQQTSQCYSVLTAGGSANSDHLTLAVYMPVVYRSQQHTSRATQRTSIAAASSSSSSSSSEQQVV